MKAPSLYRIDCIAEKIVRGDWPSVSRDGARWLPARPEGMFSITRRIKLAVMVLTGKADAVTWPGDQ